jgi:hypothetical protein
VTLPTKNAPPAEQQTAQQNAKANAVGKPYQQIIEKPKLLPPNPPQDVKIRVQ